MVHLDKIVIKHGKTYTFSFAYETIGRAIRSLAIDLQELKNSHTSQEIRDTRFIFHNDTINKEFVFKINKESN